jgi:uncharacterized protein YceK
MRNVILSILIAASLSGCATVSMVATEATVETGMNAEESSLRKVSTAYTDLAERKTWIAKNKGLLGFARVLMDGASDEVQEDIGKYANQVLKETVTLDERVAFVTADIQSAAHGLDVATMEAEKLFETDRSARALRGDLLSYESALVTAKKARRTFVTSLNELDMNAFEAPSTALRSFDISIDLASDAADTLALFAAERKNQEAQS